MIFRDAKQKLSEAAWHDPIVRAVSNARLSIERESGRPISDEHFYAALAVAMMESRENVTQAYLAHMASCISARFVIMDRNPLTPVPELGRNISGSHCQMNHSCLEIMKMKGFNFKPLTLQLVFTPVGSRDRLLTLNDVLRQIDREAVEDGDVHE